MTILKKIEEDFLGENREGMVQSWIHCQIQWNGTVMES